MKKETKTMPKLIASALIAGGLVFGCGINAKASPQNQTIVTQEQKKQFLLNAIQIQKNVTEKDLENKLGHLILLSQKLNISQKNRDIYDDILKEIKQIAVDRVKVLNNHEKLLAKATTQKEKNDIIKSAAITNDLYLKSSMAMMEFAEPVLSVKDYNKALVTNDVGLLKKLISLKVSFKDIKQYQPVMTATLRSLQGKVKPEFYATLMRNVKDEATLVLSANAILQANKNPAKHGFKKENVLKTMQIFMNNTPRDVNLQQQINKLNQKQR